jgi:small ligand-binding sensory domain FIST
MKFRFAHAAHSDWSVAADMVLGQLALQAGDETTLRGANLGFVYLTDHFAPHADQLLTLLKSRTGVPSWVGASGSAICAGATEYIDEPALTVMLGRFPAGSFNVFSGTQRPPALGTRTDQQASAAFTALVHADPRTPDLPELICDMADKVESGYLFGGLASGREDSLAVADRPLRGGLSGVVFASDVALVSRVTQGCHPFAGSRTRAVTRGQENIIATLDGERAFDVLLRDVGLEEHVAASAGSESAREMRAQLQRLARRGLFVGIEPADDGSYRERVLRNDYMARHVVALDPAKGLVAVAAPVETGQRIRFCMRDETAARKDLVRICAEIRDHLHERAESRAAPVSARGAIYVSCVGRGTHMFGEPGEELRLIQEHLGSVPLVGFYANGEIGGRNLYGFTGVLTVFY